jgi:lactoylglutathione lyase
MILRHRTRALTAVASIIRVTSSGTPLPRLSPPLRCFSSLSSSSSSPRPFRVLGLQQLAIGSLSKASLLSLWSDLLGLPVHSTFTSPSENVDESILHLGPPSSPLKVELDLMQPLDPTRSPKVHVPPLNHVGLWVDDLPACVGYLEGKGVRFTPGGIRRGASGFDVCFIHPKGEETKGTRGGEGVLIELVQAPAEVIDAYTGQGR